MSIDSGRRRHPNARAARPQGQITRGKTARNRLRRVDAFLTLYDPAALGGADSAGGGWFVDLGFGAEPWTTLESAHRLRRHNPWLPVLGVEIDPERVAAAEPYGGDGIVFRRGGFNLPLVRDGTNPEWVRVIRAFNVLRQYDEDAVAGAYRGMALATGPGTLLIEGTSDPLGRIWTANVARRSQVGETGWEMEALVFSTSFGDGFDPALFQPVLPKNYIHRMVPGEPVHWLMEQWKRAAAATQFERVWGMRAWFAAAALALQRMGVPVDARPRWTRRGFLVVNCPFT
jgi:hypothetical protein